MNEVSFFMDAWDVNHRISDLESNTLSIAQICRLATLFNMMRICYRIALFLIFFQYVIQFLFLHAVVVNSNLSFEGISFCLKNNDLVILNFGNIKLVQEVML